MGKNKNKKTNATTKSKKEDGPAREKNSQERIRASKRKEEEDEINLKELEEERKKVEISMKEKAERMKAEETRLMEAEEARLKEAEEARLIEKQKNKSQFGGLTYLVVEFPKGGQLNRFLGSQHYIPPCTVKGIYVKMDAPNFEKSVDGLVEMKNIFQGRRNDIRFLPLSRYNKKLLKFLKHFYVKGNAKRNIEWYTAYYWRLEWLKQGFPHVIDELDFYWKIFDLYSKFPMDRFLLSCCCWWGDDAGYYKVEFPSETTDQIMVMVCRAYDIFKEISHVTKKRPAILSSLMWFRRVKTNFHCF